MGNHRQPAGQRFYEATGAMVLDGEEGIPVEANLGDARFWALALLPVLAIPFGVIGAGAGAWFRRKISE